MNNPRRKSDGGEFGNAGQNNRGGSACSFVKLFRQAGLFACGGVLVDRALCGGLVQTLIDLLQLLCRGAPVALLQGLLEAANRALYLVLAPTIARTPLYVLTNSFLC